MDIKITLLLFLIVYQSTLSWCQDMSADDQLFYNHLVNTSRLRFLKLGNEMKHILNPIVDVSPVSANISEHYNKELLRLFTVMSKHEIKYDLELQFYFLYIVQANNIIFVNNGKMLLDNIVEYLHKNIMEIDKPLLEKLIKSEAESEKIATLLFVCYKLQVCRSHPAMTEHIAELIRGILKLSDKKLRNFSTLFQDIIGVKIKFFQSIMNEDIAFKLSSKLKGIAQQTEELRFWLKFIVEIIDNKLLYFKKLGETIFIQTKATRLLMDMFDKAFDSVGNELIGIEFENVKRAVKEWSQNAIKYNDITETLREFCDYITDILNYQWDIDTKHEAKILLEMLMMGTSTENNILVNDLLYKGSKYLNTEYFMPPTD